MKMFQEIKIGRDMLFMKNDSSQRIDYLSTLNVISAVAVVFLHSNSCFWVFSRERYWFTANIIESVFYFAVPVFFMNSGATLIDYPSRYDTKTFFEKRIQKSFIPYIVWSCIFFVYYYIMKGNINDISLRFIWELFSNNKIVGIYWFFPTLFSVYLCIPLFAYVNEDKKNTVFLFLTCAGFVLNSLLPFICDILKISKLPIHVNVIETYLLYVIIGYLISHYNVSRNIEIIIYSLGIIGLGMQIIGTYILSVNAGEIIQTFKGYNNVPCIFYSVSIFLFVAKHDYIVSKIRARKIIDFLSKFTFGIYLLHYPLLFIVRENLYYNYLGIIDKSIVYRLTLPFILIFCCIVIIWFIRKLPCLRFLVP